MEDFPKCEIKNMIFTKKKEIFSVFWWCVRHDFSTLGKDFFFDAILSK